jgi:hypothetical protein
MLTFEGRPSVPPANRRSSRPAPWPTISPSRKIHLVTGLRRASSCSSWLQFAGPGWNHCRPVVGYSRRTMRRPAPPTGALIMMRFAFYRPSRRATVIACAMVLFLWVCAGLRPALAAAGPFADFHGRWSGTGTVRQQGSSAERIRCNANYRVLGSTAHEADLQLRCNSDSYNFDLAGQFQADASNQISGRWTEQSRNIGGTVIGNARGNRIQIHVESSAFAATLYMVTRNRRQTVTIDSQGGGQIVKASISLHRH